MNRNHHDPLADVAGFQHQLAIRTQYLVDEFDELSGAALWLLNTLGAASSSDIVAFSAATSESLPESKLKPVLTPARFGAPESKSILRSLRADTLPHLPVGDSNKGEFWWPILDPQAPRWNKMGALQLIARSDPAEWDRQRLSRLRDQVMGLHALITRHLLLAETDALRESNHRLRGRSPAWRNVLREMANATREVVSRAGEVLILARSAAVPTSLIPIAAATPTANEWARNQTPTQCPRISGIASLVLRDNAVYRAPPGALDRLRGRPTDPWEPLEIPEVRWSDTAMAVMAFPLPVSSSFDATQSPTAVALIGMRCSDAVGFTPCEEHAASVVLKEGMLEVMDLKRKDDLEHAAKVYGQLNDFPQDRTNEITREVKGFDPMTQQWLLKTAAAYKQAAEAAHLPSQTPLPLARTTHSRRPPYGEYLAP